MRHAVAVAAALAAASAQSTLHAAIDPSATFGTWGGWGSSLCWWANGYGARADLISAIFTKASTLITDARVTVPGLSLNIGRYNAGGTSFTPVNGSSMVVSPNIPKWKQIEGFWIDGASTDPTSASWNWTRDANQRAVVQAARTAIEASGRPAVFELFSNSPMWYLLTNRNPSGNGANDNLRTDAFQWHAVYMATVAAHFKAAENITFGTVEAFNEPSGDWGATGTQEVRARRGSSGTPLSAGRAAPRRPRHHPSRHVTSSPPPAPFHHFPRPLDPPAGLPREPRGAGGGAHVPAPSHECSGAHRHAHRRVR